MQLLRRFWRRLRSGSARAAGPRSDGRARGSVTGGQLDDAGVAALINGLIERAQEEAVEIDASRIDRIAARVVRRGYQGVPEVVAFPSSARRIIEVSKRDDGDVNPLVHAISQDAAVTASLIAISNSAALAPASPITTVRDAVLRLGAIEASRAALAVAMRGMYRGKATSADTALRQQFFADSLADGFSAVWLAESLRLPGAERAFVVTMVRELARPAALSILEEAMPEEAARLGVPETVAVVDAAAPMIARALGESLGLPDGLDEGLSPPGKDTTPLVHAARLVGALGALLRCAPGPSTWAQQAHGAALSLELGTAAMRATIRQREDDEKVAQRIAVPA